MYYVLPYEQDFAKNVCHVHPCTFIDYDDITLAWSSHLSRMSVNKKATTQVGPLQCRPILTCAYDLVVAEYFELLSFLLSLIPLQINHHVSPLIQPSPYLKTLHTMSHNLDHTIMRSRCIYESIGPYPRTQTLIPIHPLFNPTHP